MTLLLLFVVLFLSIDLLFRPDALQQHTHHPTQEVILEDGNRIDLLDCHLLRIEFFFSSSLDIDPPFSPRIVTIKKNKKVTDEYELMEFLGR